MGSLSDPGPFGPLTLSKLDGGVKPSEVKRELLSSIGLFIGTGLLGFWFGIGAILAIMMVNSLEELISR